jgi:hypothetical protein
MAKSMLAKVGTFEMVVKIYPLRQLLFCHLGALDVARVIDAARLQGAVGKKERERFLNPLRDLFTDAELLGLQEMMNDGAAITLWGSNLKRFLERTEDQSCYMDKHQSSAELNLAITAFPAHPFEANSSMRAKESWRFKSSLFREHTITLPGEWEPWAYAPPWLSTGSESYPSERLKLNTPDRASSLIEIPYDFALESRSYFSRMLIPSAGVLKVMQYGSGDPETHCPCHNHHMQYVNLQESGLVLHQSHSKCWSQDPLVADGSLPGSWPKGIFKLLYRQTKTIPENGFTFPRFRYDRYMMQIRADPPGQGIKSAP